MWAWMRDHLGQLCSLFCFHGAVQLIDSQPDNSIQPPPAICQSGESSWGYWQSCQFGWDVSVRTAAHTQGSQTPHPSFHWLLSLLFSPVKLSHPWENGSSGRSTVVQLYFSSSETVQSCHMYCIRKIEKGNRSKERERLRKKESRIDEYTDLGEIVLPYNNKKTSILQLYSKL